MEKHTAAEIKESIRKIRQGLDRLETRVDGSDMDMLRHEAKWVSTLTERTLELILEVA
jgi:hypothetical protein